MNVRSMRGLLCVVGVEKKIQKNLQSIEEEMEEWRFGGILLMIFVLSA